MSPSTARSPATNARATPSSPGAQRMRRTASEPTGPAAVPIPSAGPSTLPSQNSKRTGTGLPVSDRSARRGGVTPPGAATLLGAVPVRRDGSPHPPTAGDGCRVGRPVCCCLLHRPWLSPASSTPRGLVRKVSDHRQTSTTDLPRSATPRSYGSALVLGSVPFTSRSQAPARTVAAPCLEVRGVG